MFKVLLALCSLGLILVIASASPRLTQADHEAWRAFKLEHGKQYADLREELMRRNLFIERKQLIEEWNAKHSARSGYKQGINHLSDRTEEERMRLNGFRLPEDHKELLRQNGVVNSTSFIGKLLAEEGDVPEEVDWRTVDGVVSSVKDQRDCGSCWAFAAVGILEGKEAKYANGLKNKGIVSLSPQQLVDCVVESNGCINGNPYSALDYTSKVGSEDDKSYPYKAVTEDQCNLKKDKVVIKNKSASYGAGLKELQLRKLVASYGPVAIGMDADYLAYYSSGIIKESKCSNDVKALNHAVLLVGYGTDKNGTKYWLVKNSWGKQWGEDGYFRILRDETNLCGVLDFVFMAEF